MKVINIPTPPYNCALHFIIEKDEEKLRRYIEKNYKCDFECPRAKGEFFSITHKEKIHFFVWVKKNDWTIDNQTTIVHELFHATHGILDWAGIKFNIEGDEAYSYFFESLFAYVWTKLQPKRKI